jgi:hypothetical protein
MFEIFCKIYYCQHFSSGYAIIPFWFIKTSASIVCEISFQELKTRLITAPVLAYPQAEGSDFILDTDASAYAIQNRCCNQSGLKFLKRYLT